MAGTIISTEDLFKENPTISTDELFGSEKKTISSEELFAKPSLAGSSLESMPSEGPEQRPPIMNQMKVYGMLEGMPAELATEIKKSAIDYENMMAASKEYGAISYPPLSLPHSLWEGFQNIPDNIKSIIRDTSSMLMYLGKDAASSAWSFGKDAFEDLNKTFSYAAQLQENVNKAQLPEYETFKRIEKVPSMAKAATKAPGKIVDWIADQFGEAENMGTKRYLYKMIEEHPVDILLVANAGIRAMGTGTRIGLQGIGKIARTGSRLSNTVENIMATERTPLVFEMPVEIGGIQEVAKTMEFPRAYSKDPIIKYAYQKSFDKILDTYPNLKEALTEHKAAQSLTRLRQAYDRAGVQERIQLHREIDQMMSTLSKDELKVMVPYLEGRAQLIGQQSDEFAKFETWYRGRMTEAQQILGLEDVDHVIYQPLAAATTKGEWKSLTDAQKTEAINRVKTEFGDFSPAYVHQVHEKVYPKKMSVEFTDTTGRRFKPGIFKRREVGQNYSEDLKVILPKWASEYVKFKNTEAFIGDLTNRYGIPVNLAKIKNVEDGLQVGDKVYRGYKIIAPDGYLRFYKGKFDAYQAIAKKLDNMDLDEAIGTTITERIEGLRETTKVLEEGTQQVLSRQAQMIEDRVREALLSRGFQSGEAEQMLQRVKSNGIQGIKTIVTEKEYSKIREIIQKRGIDPDKIKESFRGMEKNFVGVTKNVKVYLVPDEIAKRLESWAVPRFGSQRVHNALKIVYDKPVGVWKDSVLAASPRWIKNNVVGDILFNTMEGVGPLSYGRSFSAKYSKLIPDELAQASFAEVMKYNPKLGMAAKNTVGRLMNDLGKTSVVRGVSKVKDTGYAINSAFEQPFVRAFYINRARKKARQMLKAEGVEISEPAILYKMEQIKNSKALKTPILNELRETLPVFDLSGNFERKYLRSAMPFYNWFKFMAKYGATLPTKHPFKTVGFRGLGGLSELERETAFKQMFPEMSEYIDENGIPDRFDNLWPIKEKDEKGEAVFFNTRGMNPFTTLEDFLDLDVVNTLSPILKIPIERAIGKEAFTNREFKTGERGRGKFKEFEKENPPLGEHVLRQFPQYQILKEILVPARQWDSGTIFNPDPILDKTTGEYKYPIKNIEKILNYLGIDKRTVDVDKAWQDLQRSRQRAIGETFQKQQSKFSKYLTSDELKQLFDYIRSDPERWDKIVNEIKTNKQLEIKQKKELIKKLRGE